ncbi:MAG: alpha/beta hydrolase [Candidatus Heimdallarchaeota archaeon]|nr:alpha/beta hydrolase [Candidatus Heimdallarchaeota archaeon]
MDMKDLFIILVAGFTNYKRKYPIYEERFSKENFAHTTNWKRFSIDEHLEEIESIIPGNREYILVGYSMGGSNILELLGRKHLPKCKGVVLVGSAHIQDVHWFLNFMFLLPVPIMYLFAIIFALLFPMNLVIAGFNLKKAVPASFEGLYMFIKHGARNMKKEYNQCIRKVGRNLSDIKVENKDIPLLIIRLEKDMMVKEEHYETILTWFNQTKIRVLPPDIIHLTHRLDGLFIDMIEEEKEFFGIK